MNETVIDGNRNTDAPLSNARKGGSISNGIGSTPMGKSMSKPQITSVQTDSFRQLTIQEVAEHIGCDGLQARQGNRATVRRNACVVEKSTEAPLEQVPEHLF